MFIWICIATIVVSLIITRFTLKLDNDYFANSGFLFFTYSLMMLFPFLNLIMSLIELIVTIFKKKKNKIDINEFAKRVFFIKGDK